MPLLLLLHATVRFCSTSLLFQSYSRLCWVQRTTTGNIWIRLLQDKCPTCHPKVSKRRKEIYIHINNTRHRASTSMYSLTFCVHFLLPERHQWKPAVQTAAVVLRTPPPAAGRPRTLPICGARFWGRPRRPPVAGRRHVQTPPSRPFALCRHITGWTQACN